MLIDLELPTLEKRRTAQRLIFMFKVVEGLVPAIVSVYSTSMDPLLDFTSTEWGALCDSVRMLESSFEALQTGLVYCVIVEMVPV
jgi:hypothetical protein